MPKIVMTFGTFDKFHPGHRYYLSEAKKHGDKLVVVIARDETVARIKSKLPQENEKVRLQNLQQSTIADEVVLGGLKDPYQVLLKYKPDILCFGYDQKSFNNEKLEQFLSTNNLKPEIIYLSSFKPEKWKSSKL